MGGWRQLNSDTMKWDGSLSCENLNVQNINSGGTGRSFSIGNGTNVNHWIELRYGSGGNCVGFSLTSSSTVLQSSASKGIVFRVGASDFETGGTVAAKILSTGLIGLGTEVPDQKLVVVGAIGGANTTPPTLTQTVTSGAIYVSGGELWYISDKSTYTLLGPR